MVWVERMHLVKELRDEFNQTAQDPTQPGPEHFQGWESMGKWGWIFCLECEASSIKESLHIFSTFSIDEQRQGVFFSNSSSWSFLSRSGSLCPPRCGTTTLNIPLFTQGSANPPDPQLFFFQRTAKKSQPIPTHPNFGLGDLPDESLSLTDGCVGHFHAAGQTKSPFAVFFPLHPSLPANPCSGDGGHQNNGKNAL